VYKSAYASSSDADRCQATWFRPRSPVTVHCITILLQFSGLLLLTGLTPVAAACLCVLSAAWPAGGKLQGVSANCALVRKNPHPGALPKGEGNPG
jgi:hypothetical protein